MAGCPLCYKTTLVISSSTNAHDYRLFDIPLAVYKIEFDDEVEELRRASRKRCVLEKDPAYLG